MVDIQVETPPRTTDLSTAELVKNASEQAGRLVRDELRLAKAEMTQKAKQVGAGTGMIGAAIVLALYGIAGLLAAAILGLAMAMPAWLAALAVGAALLLIGLILALVGRARLRAGIPPLPAEAIDSAKADIEQMRERVQR